MSRRTRVGSGSGAGGGTAPKTIRAVSGGLRIPIKFQNSTTRAHAMNRIRRTALVDMSGIVKFIMPLFYMDRPGSILREIDFPDPCKIQVGIEPNYLESHTGIAASQKIFSEVYTYDPLSPPGFVVLTVDLGTQVIPKGQKYGIWTAYDNLKADTPWFQPQGNKAYSEFDDVYEYSNTRTQASGSFIDTGDFYNLDSVPTTNNVQDCYGPAALLCASSEDVWLLFGSSSLEGAYDNNQGDARGDADGNRAWGDRLITGRKGLPCVNLSKGSDSLGYITSIDTELVPNRPVFYWRKQIAELCAPTHVACTIGSNDITSSLTEANFKAMFNQHVSEVKEAVGDVPIFGATYTPKIDWTSPFLTLADQTVKPTGFSGNDPLRQEFNRWMRSETGDFTIDGFIDAAFAVEAQESIGKWQVDDVTPKLYTDDGTHPNEPGAQHIADGAGIYQYYT